MTSPFFYWCILITVMWPGIFVNRVETWKVLELSGLASSSRKASIFTKSGYVYVDNEKVTSLKDTVEVGKPFVLSVRFPSGITKEETIYVVNRMYHEATLPRRGDLE